MKKHLLSLVASLIVFSLLLQSSPIQARSNTSAPEAPFEDSQSTREFNVPKGLTSSEWQDIQNQITSSLSQQAYLKASNTGYNDSFGENVDLSGDTIVIGAHAESSNATGINGDQSNNSASGSGAVYVFVRSGTTWTQQAYLKASNTNAGDYFGSSVAISGDTIIVGAYREDSAATGINGDQSDNSANDAGAAYVFVRNGATWSQQAYLKASNAEAVDNFGHSVDISGETLVVGALGECSAATGIDGNQSSNSKKYSGAAYVYVRNGTTWSQQAYMKASNPDYLDQFGDSIAISGNTIVVGALSEDSNATGVNGNQSDNSVQGAGAAYVFVRDGSTWSQQAYLKASNPEYMDIFGSVVAISEDTIVIGAKEEDSNAIGINGNQSDNSAPASGAAYVFVRNGTAWAQQAYLKASNTGANDQFGRSVAISGDTIVIGAYWEDSSSTGVNGDQINNDILDAGAAYGFFRNGTTWTQQAYLKASNPEAEDYFGISVTNSSNTIVVGANWEDSNATGVDGDQTNNNALYSGAAYVFNGNLAPIVDPSLSTVSVDISSMLANGTASATVTVTLKDANNKPVPGKFVKLVSSRGSQDIITQPPTAADGQGQAVGYVTSLYPGDSQICAIVTTDNVLLDQCAAVQFTSLSSNLATRVEWLNTVSTGQLEKLQAIAQSVGTNGSYFVGNAVADAVSQVLDTVFFFVDSVEAVHDTQRLQGAVQVTLPGVIDNGFDPITDFQVQYPQSRNIIDITHKGKVIARAYDDLAQPMLQYGPKYFASQAKQTVIEEIAKSAVVDGYRGLFNSIQGFSNAGNIVIYDLVSLRSYLDSQKELLLLKLPLMTDAQISAYIFDLQSRSMVPYVLTSVHEEQNLLISQLRDAYEKYNNNIPINFLLLFLKTSSTVIATAAYDGPGKLAVDSIYFLFDSYKNKQNMSVDLTAIAEALGVMYDLPRTANKVFLNELNAIDDIKKLNPPKTITAQLTDVRHYSQGVDFGLFFNELRSFTEMDITNLSATETGTFEAFARYGFYTRMYMTTQVYTPIVVSQTVTIPPGETRTVRIYHKELNNGGSPEDDSLIFYDVLASNTNGTYYIDSVQRHWNPIEVDVINHVVNKRINAGEYPTIPNPIDSYVFSNQAEQNHRAQLFISNPFSETIDMTVSQEIPAGVQVQETDGTLSGSTITWQLTPAAGDILSVYFTFTYQGDTGQDILLPSASMTFTEPLGDTSVIMNSNETNVKSLSLVKLQSFPPLGVEGYPASLLLEAKNFSELSQPIAIKIRILDSDGILLYETVSDLNLDGMAPRTISMPLPNLDHGSYRIDTYLTYNEYEEKVSTDAYEVRSPYTNLLPMIVK